MTTTTDYQQFVADVKQRIRQAQYQALKAVNKEQIQLYWALGRLIVERQQQHGWGKSIVGQLDTDLQTEFPGLNGFSSANRWRMRDFFLAYGQNEKLAPLVREISGRTILPSSRSVKTSMNGCFTFSKRAGTGGVSMY